LNEEDVYHDAWTWADDQDPVGYCGAAFEYYYGYLDGNEPYHLVDQAECDADKARHNGSWCQSWWPDDPDCQDVWVEKDTSYEPSCTE